MGNEKQNPAELLGALHGEDSERGIILLVEPDEVAREVQARLLDELFPEYGIAVAIDHEDAAAKFSTRFKDRVAMVVAEMDSLSYGLLGTLIGEETQGDARTEPKMPIVLTLSDPEKADRAAATLKAGAVDGLINKPFGKEALERMVLESIHRRRALFEDIERECKADTLGEFCAYNIELAKQWAKGVEVVSFFDDSIDYPDDSKEADLIAARKSALGIIGLLSEIAALGPDPGREDLSKLIHDLNNKLFIISYLDILLENDLGDADKKLLSVMRNEAYQLKRHVDGISSAYKGERPWAAVKKADYVSQLREHLEFPKGTVFCVIDDDEGILKIARRNIEKKGGVAHEVTSEDGAMLLFEDLRAFWPGVDIVLLDNNLGDDKFGHELIDMIRSFFPDVLIIAHTSDAAKINADPENPYKQKEVSVVGKREWGAISEIIRREFKPRVRQDVERF